MARAGARDCRPVRHRRGPLHEHSADSHAIRPQRHLQRTDAQQDCRDVSRAVGRRGRGGGQKPQRGAAHTDPARPLPPPQLVLV